MRIGAPLVLTSLLLAALPAFGENMEGEYGDASERAGIRMEEVVVTATRIEDPLRSIPKNITIISGEEIAQAPSNNVVDLLAREANVNLRSYFGGDKWGGVDIRGMGDPSVSNVVVMVDGYRLNPPDLAGPDFSSIPLDQIERIEILRGAGSVVYGDGAVGGVVNIITKKGEGKPQVRVYNSYGNYKTFDGRVSTRGKVKGFGFNLNGDYYTSEGYRENGFLRKKDVGANLFYDLKDWLTLSLNSSHHEDRYGLPGYVSKEDFKDKERRVKTFTPDDSGETEDDRVMGGMEMELGPWGRFEVHRGYRFRDNRYVMGFNPLIPRSEQTDRIDEDTRMLDASYIKELEFWGRKHRFQIGMDQFKTDYVREELSRSQRKNSEVKNLGLFFTHRWRPVERLSFNWGYRQQKFEGFFRDDQQVTSGGTKRWVHGIPFSREWENEAWDTGVVLDLTSNHSLFAGYATSFRNPNVDELAFADEDLHPQKGKHIEVGSRHVILRVIEFSATLFQMKIEDEIYYGQDQTGRTVNRNFDEKTVRKGIETALRFFPTENLTLWANHTYMSGRFDVKDTRVPLVPRYKTSCGLEWGIIEPLVLALSGTWVGDRIDGNDEDGILYDELESYKLFDVKLTYHFKSLKVFAGVNNIFNELYSTVGYSENYYPMPTRNFFAGAEWTF